MIPSNCTLTFFCNDFTIFVCKKMQLKSIFAPFFDGSQSYLIGIESIRRHNLHAEEDLSIVPYWNWKVKGQGVGRHLDTLNRTLLELKDETKLVNDYYFERSQSYLIGIERPEIGKIVHGNSLSIVPYWNWKYFSTCASASLKALNRTLLELKV